MKLVDKLKDMYWDGKIEDQMINKSLREYRIAIFNKKYGTDIKIDKEAFTDVKYKPWL